MASSLFTAAFVIGLSALTFGVEEIRKRTAYARGVLCYCYPIWSGKYGACPACGGNLAWKGAPHGK